MFPDGELTGSGRIITEMQNAGLEVRHEENLREHYALTLKGWCENLEANWDECVSEVGEGTAKVWGLYMAGSRLSLRAQRDPAAPGARGQARPERRRPVPAAAHLARLTRPPLPEQFPVLAKSPRVTFGESSAITPPRTHPLSWEGA